MTGSGENGKKYQHFLGGIFFYKLQNKKNGYKNNNKKIKLFPVPKSFTSVSKMESLSGNIYILSDI